ncbi:hypothetical protein [Peribacillus sp. SCS-37]|uniref:hypothetical protein n=1 Tax=Paraperibacillus esterisolvens TaxID=3115296 RepID=UPI00390593BC
MKIKKIMSQHQVSVSAESFTATLFAWAGFDVSVQYGANQPEYDLIVAKGDKMAKVSVKGSQDGGWGLTQKYLKNSDYHGAIDNWLENHSNKTIFSLVQFKGVDFELDMMPKVYLASPLDIAGYMKTMRNGTGNTSLKMYHEWKTGVAKGIVILSH